VVVSDARREANRKNALKSTGPKSEDGKARVGRNALKHGLTSLKVAVEGEEGRIYEERLAAFRDQFQPKDAWQEWLVEQLAGLSLRLGRIERTEGRLRTVEAWRAGTLWGEDRRLEVEKVGANLEREPAKVVATLRQSPRGCDWQIERWASLARIADGTGARGWTEAQTHLALDLPGTPEASRVGPPGVVIDEEGRITGPAPSPAQLARCQVVELQALRETVGEADEARRAMVEAGLIDAPSREVANIRRYERAAHRQLYWLAAQMKEAGVRPQTQPAKAERSPEPTTLDLDVRAEDGRVAIESRTHDESCREVEFERNKITPSVEDDETKPLRVESAVRPVGSKGEIASESASTPPRKRPDLAKLVQRDRDRRSA